MGSIPVDIAVIGGGPGGYAAALAARRLERSVAVLERSDVVGHSRNVVAVDMAMGSLQSIGGKDIGALPFAWEPRSLDLLTRQIHGVAAEAGAAVHLGQEIRAADVVAGSDGRFVLGPVTAQAVIDSSGGALGLFPQRNTGRIMRTLMAPVDELVDAAPFRLGDYSRDGIRQTVTMRAPAEGRSTLFAVFHPDFDIDVAAARERWLRRAEEDRTFKPFSGSTGYGAVRDAIAKAVPLVIRESQASEVARDGVYAIGDSVAHRLPTSRVGVAHAIADAVDAVAAIDSTLSGSADNATAAHRYSNRALLRAADALGAPVP